MSHFALLRCTLAIALLATAFAENLEHIDSSINFQLDPGKLHATIRNAMSHAVGNKLKGDVSGGFKQKKGHSKYSGSFHGYTLSQMGFLNFNFTRNGNFKAIGVSVMYKSSINGFIKGDNNAVQIDATYCANVSGVMHGKKAYGTSFGGVQVWFKPGSSQSVLAKETGNFHFYVGGKPVVGKYTVDKSRIELYVAIRGKYGNEKFFFQRRFSLSLLSMGFQLNPFAETHGFGKVNGTVNGKKYSKSFDFKAENQLIGSEILGMSNVRAVTNVLRIAAGLTEDITVWTYYI